MKTLDHEIFRSIQRLYHRNAIPFFTYNLPENRTLKVVIRGIPTDISDDEIASELETKGFSIKTIKRFAQFVNLCQSV